MALEKSLREAELRFQQRASTLPCPQFDERLPITGHKDAILKAIQEHPAIIIAGETGSGKTTQIPKLCLAAGRGRHGRIGCTQPRRIAALSVAERIAEELHTPLGQAVGCKVRFKDQTREETVIKLMTDGILLAESLSDPFLNQYDTLIIDEAHERSLNIDFLLGFLIRLTRKRKDLKVIITSATIDTEKFSEAFSGAPILTVSGRMYPVEVRYQPQPEEEEKGPSLAEQVAVAVDDLMVEDPFGDILVFLPTEQDIREACDLLSGRSYKGAVILPLYARLTGAEQRRVFQPAAGRKIVVATNVAETSLTIPGIRYVVDTGVARVPRYLPGMRSTSLPIVPISRSSADQRKGRCGRVANGICIRLYSEESYEMRERFTTPEILRANLADVLLKMTALRLGDIRDFPFVDRPADRLIKDGYDVLQELGAIRPKKASEKGDTPFVLTPVGERMAVIPLDPRIARMLVAAEGLGCVEDVAIIAAGITAVDPRERPEDKRQQALQAQKPFVDPLSDFITLLNIWRQFIKESGGSFGIARLKKFTERYFLSFKRMREWRDLGFQIFEMLEESDMDVKNSLLEEKTDPKSPFSPRYAAIHKAVITGYLSNIARKKEKNIMLAPKNREVMIFPGSGLFNQAPEWIVAAEMVETSRLFARCAAALDPAWIVEVGGELVTENLYEPHWEKNRGAVMAFRRRSLYGLVLSDRESVPYGSEDPETATRIFIQSALVQGEVKQPPPFLLHNQKVVAAILEKEDRLRRRDLFAGETALFDFYAQRIEGIFDIRTLLHRIRERGSDLFLRMEEKDLLIQETDDRALKLFPEKISLGKKAEFPCRYTFTPGEETDGITVRIPVNRVTEVNPHELEWLVPGLFPEKIEALLKGLPKILRKRLVPLPETAKDIARELKPEGRPLALALSRFLYQRYNVDVAPARFSEEQLPPHLKLRLHITDNQGETLCFSRDPAVLVENMLEARKDKTFENQRREWEKFPVTPEDLDLMPESLPSETGNPGSEPLFCAFTCLEKGVGKSLFTTKREARSQHEKAIRRLLEQELRPELSQLGRLLSLPSGLNPILLHFGGKERFEGWMKEAICAPLLEKDLRSRKAFESTREETRRVLLPLGRKLLEALVPVLLAAEETRETFAALRKKGGPKTSSFMDRLDRDMKRLLPENFVSLYAAERLVHFPRYLKAMTLRAQRAVEDFMKDERKATEVQIYEKALKEILSSLSPHVSEEKKEEVEKLFWMIEEFKVSVFAQEVGAAGAISAKRLKDQIARIQALV